MTSPSMKSIEKKTPEKKPAGSASEGETSPENVQDTPRAKLNLNNFAWFRIFRFGNLLCKQGCHLVMGIFQEKILKRPYGDEDFKLAIAYVAVQCISYAVISKVAILITNHQKNEVSQIYYGLPAIFYVLAMLLSNTALKYVSYPTQVVGKSCKPIAVMLLGILIGRKNYTLKKFIIVILIVTGVIIFSWKDKGTDKKEDNTQIIGMTLILGSLLMDGLMGGTQDRMRSISKPSSLNLMFFLNAWSSLYLFLLLLITLEGLEFLKFCSRQPQIILDLCVVVFVGCIAQYFISDLIRCFGALPLSIALTTRKFITVFLSVLIYGNELLLRQWIATPIIFLALLADAIIQTDSKAAKDEDNDLKNEKEIELKVQDQTEKEALKIEDSILQN